MTKEKPGHPSSVYLSTSHLASGLKNRTVSSGMIMGALQVGMFTANLLAIMVLARLLEPKDFGVVAMVSGFMGFFRIFNDAGLSTATIQRDEITHAQVSNLFWTNIALGGAITVVVALCSPGIAWFYREPQLVWVTLALSSVFVLSSSTVQHQALLKRQMQFKAVAIIQMSSTAVGIAVAIALAMLGFGYWCLVGMQVSTVLAMLTMSWIACGWRPQRPERASGTGSLLRFGANLTLTGFLWSVARGVDSLIIGRLFGSESLGLYSRATGLVSRPLEQAVTPLESVFVPIFSRLQQEPERYRRAVFLVNDSIALCSLPVSAVLLSLAEPLTLLVLGEKWRAAIPIFAASILYSVYFPMVLVPGWMLSSQGRGRDFLRLGCFTAVITVISFILGASWGPLGLALCFSLSCLLIHLPITFWIAGRMGPVSTRDLWAKLLQHAPLWVGVYVMTALIQSSLRIGYSSLFQVLVGVIGGIVVGSVLALINPPSRRTLIELLEIGREWIKTRGAIVPAV